LDSLDECRLRVPQVAALLMEQLHEVREHIDRLRLRIACRTAEWPSQLEEGLPELWGKEQVGSFQLVPLRRKDILLAAEIEGVADPESFLSAIADKSAQALAIKPVTLRFLISAYRRDGGFPPQEVDLYRSGCQLLVTEPSQSRQDAKEKGRLDPTQRLAVAARIAAISMFCKKAAIYLGNDTGGVSVDDVRIDELGGGTESANANAFPVNDVEIREVLETGLFSSRGPHRLGFAHQTYSEFLAAQYLIDRHLEARQMLALIRHPEQSDGTIVPQTRGDLRMAGRNETRCLPGNS
jgi:predicted NACHT family NTPase